MHWKSASTPKSFYCCRWLSLIRLGAGTGRGGKISLELCYSCFSLQTGSFVWCVDLCVLSVISPPSLNLPLLSLRDWAGSVGLNPAYLGVGVTYTHYLRNELISWYSATAWDKLKASADFSQQTVKFVKWRRFTPGVELQGLFSLLTVFPPSKAIFPLVPTRIGSVQLASTRFPLQSSTTWCAWGRYSNASQHPVI